MSSASLFWAGVLLCCLVWPGTRKPPASVSWIAGITDRCHPAGSIISPLSGPHLHRKGNHSDTDRLLAWASNTNYAYLSFPICKIGIAAVARLQERSTRHWCSPLRYTEATVHMKTCSTLLFMRDMQIETVRRYGCTATPVTKMEKAKASVDKMQRNWNSQTLLIVKRLRLSEISLAVPQNGKQSVFIWTSNFTSGLYQGEMKTCVSTKSSSGVFRVALFIVAKEWKSPKCPSANEWISKRGVARDWDKIHPYGGVRSWFMSNMDGPQNPDGNGQGLGTKDHYCVTPFTQTSRNAGCSGGHL